MSSENEGSDIDDLFDVFDKPKGETKPAPEADADVEVISVSDDELKGSSKKRSKSSQGSSKKPKSNNASLNTTVELDTTVEEADNASATTPQVAQSAPVQKEEKPQELPYFVIRFRNNELYKKYGSRIERFMQVLTTEKDFPTSSGQSEGNEEPELKIFGSFSVDPDQEFRPTNAVTYETDFNMALTEEKEDECPAPEKTRSKLMCFNCLESHNLRDCPHKKDFKQINKNKLEFMKNKNTSTKGSRYHIEVDEDSMYNVVPGEISDQLRVALGLRPDELPTYIYQMRVLGYPPGWLEEAKVETSGISIIQGKGDDECELEPQTQYDFSKVHDYPGFNVFPPSGTLDRAHSLGYPPIMPHHLKVNWEQQLRGSLYSTPGKSLKGKKSNNGKHKSDTEKRPAKSQDETPVSSKRRPADPDDSLNLDDSIGSVSMEELERRKKQLMDALGAMVSSKEMGTPVLESVSPYNKLPEISKFSSNITDYIPFDNLPGYTGTYKRIGKLLKKMRKKKS